MLVICDHGHILTKVVRTGECRDGGQCHPRGVLHLPRGPALRLAGELAARLCKEAWKVENLLAEFSMHARKRILSCEMSAWSEGAQNLGRSWENQHALQHGSFQNEIHRVPCQRLSNLNMRPPEPQALGRLVPRDIASACS